MIKIFIIDDALLVRNAIKKILRYESTIEVIGEAGNPIDAFDEFKKTGLPDVFILDIEMPKMDGLTFLKKIQVQKPIPTIICSSYVTTGSSKTIDSLRFGACDIILKPNISSGHDYEEIHDELVTKIKAAAQSKRLLPVVSKIREHQNKQIRHLKEPNDHKKIVVIGASTGGVQTLEAIFIKLRPNHAPIVVVQHMPVGFTESFANSLNNTCPNSIVKEAKEGDVLLNGHILIAPGNLHMEVIKGITTNYQVALKNFPKVSGHKPSVDVLFTSAAKVIKSDTVAFILTGMGKDGSQGLLKIKQTGAKTYGQDKATSIVYGMPKIAHDIGVLTRQVSIGEVSKIINFL